jgi:hypothetical protein
MPILPWRLDRAPYIHPRLSSITAHVATRTHEDTLAKIHRTDVAQSVSELETFGQQLRRVAGNRARSMAFASFPHPKRQKMPAFLQRDRSRGSALCGLAKALV